MRHTYFTFSFDLGLEVERAAGGEGERQSDPFRTVIDVFLCMFILALFSCSLVKEYLDERHFHATWVDRRSLFGSARVACFL